jgi:hypothetical protein
MDGYSRGGLFALKNKPNVSERIFSEIALPDPEINPPRLAPLPIGLFIRIEL